MLPETIVLCQSCALRRRPKNTTKPLDDKAWRQDEPHYVTSGPLLFLSSSYTNKSKHHVPYRTFNMTSNRSNLPIPGSRVPRKVVCTSSSRTETPGLSQRTVKSLASVKQSGIARPLKPRTQRPEARKSPQQPTSASKAPVPATRSLTMQEHATGDESESTSISKFDSCSEDCSDRNTTNASSILSNEPSLYNGPQLVEPCVSNALLHVLEPCGHRVMITRVELCGKNCRNSDSAFANSRTATTYACAVCITKHLQEQHSTKKSLFVSSLDKLESALGGFRAGWKAERIARMERIWKNDAVEERKALKKLGMHCEVIPTDPEEETLVVPTEVAPTKDASPQVQSSLPSRPEVKTVRRSIPVSKKHKGKRQVPTSSSSVPVEGKAVGSKRGKFGSSRIPVGPRLSKK